MPEMKYIIVEPGGDAGLTLAVLFPGLMVHATMAEHVEQAYKWKTVRAGFCKLGEKGLTCFGESSSMKGMKSDPLVDQPIIAKQLFGLPYGV